MEVFIDESGNFDLKQADDVSVLCTLIIPDCAKKKLDSFWKRFEKQVSKSERDSNGEIKGSQLLDSNMNKVFTFIGRNLDIRLCVSIIPHAQHTTAKMQTHRADQAKRLKNAKEKYMSGPVKAKAVKDFIEEKERWAENPKKIGDADYVKMQMMNTQLSEALKKIFMHYYGRKYAKSFEEFDFFVDESSSKKMKKYINETLVPTLDSRANGLRLNMIEGFEHEGHPVKKYLTEIDGKEGYSISQIFKNGVQFVDSKDYVGIQLVDIVAAGVRQMTLGERPVEMFNPVKKNAAFYEERWTPVRVLHLTDDSVKLEGAMSKRIASIQKPQKDSFNRSMGKKFVESMEKDKK
ncbi:DUF3800 domain-containing protein [Patescibacteria group bacterium]|nr:DUF3800 domain-containing protein [Patescibacteria group bacterium]